MRYLHLLITFIFGIQSATAQTTTILAPSQLPDSLKKNAHAVYQLDETEITLKSISEMKYKTHTVITLLDEKALHHRTIRIGVDKFIKLDQVTVKVFAADGREVFHFKKKDFKLEGAFDGFSLATDNKVYTLDFPIPGLPCTIESLYELNFDGFIDIPEAVFGSKNESILTGRYTVISSIPVQYKTYNFKSEPEIKKEGAFTQYKWEQFNKPVIIPDVQSFGAEEITPKVDVSPAEFSFDGYKGSLSNWKDFGKWFYPFYEEQGELPKERVDFYKQLIAAATTNKERISILYKYLQKETRYVSIQLGIGGFKPFSASFAESKKYGDCKGLTHYMKYMLRCVGIKAYPAIINAGANEYPVDPDFASNNFNHVILCVPDGKDTVWLECTAKQTEPGILGNFTENRYALLITENGGVMVRTPSSNYKSNQWIANTTIEIDEEGGAVAKSRIFISGEFWSSFHHYTNAESQNNIKYFLVHVLGYKSPDEFETKILNDSAGGHMIEINMAYSKLFDFKTGSKYFFPIRHYKINDETIQQDPNRKQDFLFDFPYIKQDITTYHLPGKFKKDNTLANKQISNPYFAYTNEFTTSENGLELKVHSVLTIKNHQVAKEQFTIVAAAFEEIKKDENQKLIFKAE